MYFVDSQSSYLEWCKLCRLAQDVEGPTLDACYSVGSCESMYQ